MQMPRLIDPFKRLRLARFLSAASLLLSGPVLAQQLLLRDTSLQADRYVDAAVLGPLRAGMAVTVLKSEAGWAQVKAENLTGWVRASTLQGAGAAQAKTAQMVNGRLAGNNILATSGVRGPEEEEEPPKAAAAETKKTAPPAQ